MCRARLACHVHKVEQIGFDGCIVVGKGEVMLAAVKREGFAVKARNLHGVAGTKGGVGFREVRQAAIQQQGAKIIVAGEWGGAVRRVGRQGKALQKLQGRFALSRRAAKADVKAVGRKVEALPFVVGQKQILAAARRNGLLEERLR